MKRESIGQSVDDDCIWNAMKQLDPQLNRIERCLASEFLTSTEGVDGFVGIGKAPAPGRIGSERCTSRGLVIGSQQFFAIVKDCCDFCKG